jgi:hypothetical protein
MKKSLLLAIAALALVGCSRHSLVTDPSEVSGKLVPVEFSVQRQNMTKATNLEAVKHYNFGVFAYKVGGKNGLSDAEVMNNYLVGYSNGTDKGYDKTNATTYKNAAGSLDDHFSPWFYEGLGTTEYTNPGAKFYQTTDTDYMSSNEHQYLRYWDLAYANTNFYAYAPYNKNVTFTHASGESTMTFGGANTIRDGYDEPLNSAYNAYSRTLGEYMYAGVHATNADLKDVVVPFAHMGAQLLLRFYEDVPGYKVELIELNADNGSIKDGISGDVTKGIQLTPAKVGTPAYTTGSYYTTQGATVKFAENTAAPTYTPDWTGSTTSKTPLMFLIPEAGKSTAADAPANLTDYKGHKIIPEVVTTGTQKYSYSPTIYYTVAQPTTSETGFTMHVSYRIIAEDNQEVITVHNATVHIPYKDSSDKLITVWQPNNKYVYTFKITKNTTGTTNPGGVIDPTDPTPSTTKSLYPIVFDNATIEDFTEVAPETVVSENTNY